MTNELPTRERAFSTPSRLRPRSASLVEQAVALLVVTRQSVVLTSWTQACPVRFPIPFSQAAFAFASASGELGVEIPSEDIYAVFGTLFDSLQVFTRTSSIQYPVPGEE